MISVSIAVEGVFHAPHLARQVRRLGRLDQLIVGHPRWLVPQRGGEWRSVRPVARSVFFSHRWPAPITSVTGRLSRTDPHDRFDAAAARVLSGDSDIVTAWSGSARRLLSVANSRGQRTVLERGSWHIEAQFEVLRERYRAAGISDGPLPDRRTIESELEEYQIADLIMVPSSPARRSFIERGFSEQRVAVAPFGVDVERFRPMSRPPSEFVVAHVGRVSAQKGVHRLLEAAAGLPEAPRVMLYGAISPEMSPFLDRYSSIIDHVGPVPQNEIASRLSNCSVMVLASSHEGLAMVIGEAMACGRPVICTPNTGGADLLTNGRDGFVLDTDDVEEIRLRLLDLANDYPRRVAMGEAARRTAEGLSWNRYGDRVWEYYSRLVGP